MKEIHERVERKGIKCDDCGEKFETETHFKIHILDSHNLNENESHSRLMNLRDVINEQEDDAKVFLNDIIDANVLETVEEFLPQECKSIVEG